MRALASLGGKSLPPSNSDFSDRLLGAGMSILSRGAFEKNSGAKPLASRIG